MFVPLSDEFERLTEEDLKRCSPPLEFDPTRVINRHLDIQYGSLPGQLLDLYLPDSVDGPLPVLFYIHGGGWIMGSRRLGGLECVISAIEHGYAVISVEYRLVSEAGFPEYIFDVKTAVRWARAHAAEFGLDPERFGMIGDSAGAHISLMLAFTADHPEYEGAQYGHAAYSSAIQAVVDMYGPTDLAADQDQWYRESKVRRSEPMSFGEHGELSMFDAAFGTDNPALLRLVSPISLVKPGIPPVLILHGINDCIVPYQNAVVLAERIKQVCGSDAVDLRLYPECNHCDWEFYGENTVRLIREFFDKHLK